MSYDSKQSSMILAGDDARLAYGVTRRSFFKGAAATVAGVYLGAFNTGCGDGTQYAWYPIDSSSVLKTTDQVLSFPIPTQPSGPNSGAGLCPSELSQISQYAKYGYGNYTFGEGLPIQQRFDIMPAGYDRQLPTRLKQLANFFAISDIHITDKEAPNQIIYLQQEDPVWGAPVTALYSPIMLYTTHVLDAAIQTINALHEKSPI